MPFTVLPAIDVTRGRLGRYTPDGPVAVEAFDGDPLAAANAFRDAGAGWLHVVDMDLAFSGAGGALDIVRAASELEGVRVQASGGVRTEEQVASFRSAGASRVVLSSAGLEDEAMVAQVLANSKVGELAIGIEVVDGRIHSRGSAVVDLDLMATLGWLREVGAASFLVTSVPRVGTTTGPDVDLIRRVVRTGVETAAAGGIATLNDLEQVRAAGAVGAVIGRAALDGTIDLAAACAWGRT
jgi:phosphoribosylformimino-5-aminoimidazole carboxamide ribonucleotide (ProFAR) isomerase